MCSVCCTFHILADHCSFVGALSAGDPRGTGEGVQDLASGHVAGEAAGPGAADGAEAEGPAGTDDAARGGHAVPVQLSLEL